MVNETDEITDNEVIEALTATKTNQSNDSGNSHQIHAHDNFSNDICSLHSI